MARFLAGKPLTLPSLVPMVGRVARNPSFPMDGSSTVDVPGDKRRVPNLVAPECRSCRGQPTLEATASTACPGTHRRRRPEAIHPALAVTLSAIPFGIYPVRRPGLWWFDDVAHEDLVGEVIS